MPFGPWDLAVAGVAAAVVLVLARWSLSAAGEFARLKIATNSRFAALGGRSGAVRAKESRVVEKVMKKLDKRLKQFGLEPDEDDDEDEEEEDEEDMVEVPPVLVHTLQGAGINVEKFFDGDAAETAKFQQILAKMQGGAAPGADYLG